MLDLPTVPASTVRRYDVAAGLGLIAVAVVHRLAWVATPPDVDPINFTLALESYSVTDQRPHAPGYPLYVFAGRAAAGLVGPAHAYQLVNLTLLLATAALLYWTLRPYSPRAALVAALVFAAHPLTLGATVVADVYVTDAFFATAIAACVRGARSPIALVAFPVLFFSQGLLRPVSCLMLAPLAVVGVALARWPAWRNGALATAAAAAAGTGAAMLVTVQLAGGPAAYAAASDHVMGASFRAASILGGAPLRIHATMVAKFAVWFLALAMPGALGVLIATRLQFGALSRAHVRLLALAALWIAPPVLFYVTIYYIKPTYQMIYLPCLVGGIGIGAAALLRRASHAHAIATALALAAVLLAAFWFAPPSLPPQLGRLTHAYAVQQDAAFQRVQALLQPIERSPRTMLIWNRHPTLSVYALRVLRWPGPTAAVAEHGPEIVFVDARSMGWLQALRPGDALPAAVEQVAVVGADRSGAVQARSVAVPPGADGAWLVAWLAGEHAPAR